MDAFATGDWDTAVAAADEMIAGAEAGYVHYLEPVCREIRARIRLARGDEDGALEDSARAVETGRGSDPQISVPALATRAFVLLALGDRDQASALLSEVLPIPGSYYVGVEVAALLHDLGREAEFSAWGPSLDSPAWHAATQEIAQGDFHAAAERLAEIGHRTHEAYCRLRSGTDADVRRALEFYRSVGAARYVREGEALLARSA